VLRPAPDCQPEHEVNQQDQHIASVMCCLPSRLKHTGPMMLKSKRSPKPALPPAG
jgi:hypothetical protein